MSQPLRFLLAAIASCTLAVPVARAADADWVAVPLDAAHWELDSEGTAPATYLGLPALRMHAGGATLPGVDLETGSIEHGGAFQAERN